MNGSEQDKKNEKTKFKNQTPNTVLIDSKDLINRKRPLMNATASDQTFLNSLQQGPAIVSTSDLPSEGLSTNESIKIQKINVSDNFKEGQKTKLNVVPKNKVPKKREKIEGTKKMSGRGKPLKMSKPEEMAVRTGNVKQSKVEQLAIKKPRRFLKSENRTQGQSVDEPKNKQKANSPLEKSKRNEVAKETGKKSKKQSKKSAGSAKSTAASSTAPSPKKSSASTTTKGSQKKGKKKKDSKSQPETTSSAATPNTEKSEASKRSKRSKTSSASSKKKKGKKGKGHKEKVKKLNRKGIYKDLKAIEKKIGEEEKQKKKLEWENNKVMFYWNCVVSKLIDLKRRNGKLKKKQEALNMEKKHALFHQYWKNMNQTRMEKEENLEAKRTEFRSVMNQLRDNHKEQTDTLFKDIQTYVKDTYLVGQEYVSDVVGIRMEYTKGMTQTLFDAREKSRLLEIEQNYLYGPIMEEFEEEMKRLRSRIPKERQERLQKMLVDANAMLVELVNVYTNILHHNFIEVCHTANKINELKSVERRLEHESEELAKRKNKMKERTEYLHERVSNLKRQVNAGRDARKKLHRVLKAQEVLQRKKDIAYINKELMFLENAKLKEAVEDSYQRVDKWYFDVKRHFFKSVVIQALTFRERALQLNNYNNLIKRLLNVDNSFFEPVETFKDHEEFEDPKEGLKILFGSFKPYTLEELEHDFEGCTESFATVIIFFKRRLQQNYLTLDDLHFFIKRRNPLSYLEVNRKEEHELMSLLKQAKQKKSDVNPSSVQDALTSFML